MIITVYDLVGAAACKLSNDKAAVVAAVEQTTAMAENIALVAAAEQKVLQTAGDSERRNLALLEQQIDLAHSQSNLAAAEAEPAAEAEAESEQPAAAEVEQPEVVVVEPFEALNGAEQQSVLEAVDRAVKHWQIDTKLQIDTDTLERLKQSCKNMTACSRKNSRTCGMLSGCSASAGADCSLSTAAGYSLSASAATAGSASAVAKLDCLAAALVAVD